MIKPTIPKGTRDFGPHEMARRKFLFRTIEEVFVKYGYRPIETPSMENLATLTGQYGEEGNKLLFKILNSGDFLSKADSSSLDHRDSYSLIPSIAKKGLRYDLTVPFARFVVNHRNDLEFPFKRYQIQPVWRADRPQRGRYQEFFQCDVDVVGSDSLMYEAELIKIYDEVFHQLNLNVTIVINNRKVLTGIAELFGLDQKFSDFATIIDKMDKVGEEQTRNSLLSIGMDISHMNSLFDIFKIDQLSSLRSCLKESVIGSEGVDELDRFHQYFDHLDHYNSVVLDTSLARGLGYYTGCIFEVTADDVEMGSIGGGGRYADLTESFGFPNMSGVGISFGAERIYDVMEELGLFDTVDLEQVKAIFLAFDVPSHIFAFEKGSQLRDRGIAVDIYPSPAKMKKQMKYASNMGYHYAVIVGSEELNNQIFTCKNLKTGEQNSLRFEELEKLLSNL